MLIVLLNNTSNNIKRGFKFAQALIKEDFKFLLSDGNVDFILYLTLILLTIKQGNIFEKDSYK